MADFASHVPEAAAVASSPVKGGWDPLKTSGISLSTPTPPGKEKLPGVRNGRRGKSQPSPARDINSRDNNRQVAPIWLGSGLKDEIITVKDIRQIVPEELHHNENVLAIERFESDAGPYEAQKKYVMAAECLEQAINLRRKFLGDMHQDFLTAIERYVVSCNLWGIRCLNAGQNSSALELLMKAEGLTEADNVPNFKRRVSLRAATFNNLCCYFRARGKLNAALQFAEKALKIEQKFKDAENPARTHLNYAVLLSMMNRHQESVEHIESAIAILHDDERQNSYQTSEPQDGDNSREQQHVEVVSTLVVAYYNHWVELGRLSRRDAGIDCILRAANIAKRKLGVGHPLTVKMEETLSMVQEQMTTARAIAHTLDTADGPADLPHTFERQVSMLSPSVAPSQLPPLDSRNAWQLAKKEKEDAVKQSMDAAHVTLRFNAEIMQPPAPSPDAKNVTLEQSLQQVRLKRFIAFPTLHKIEKPRLQSVGKTFAVRSKPSTAPAQLGKGKHSARSKRDEQQGAAQLDASALQATAKMPLEPKPPTEIAPSSPYLREAYAYHMREAAKRKSMDGKEQEPDLPLERDRIQAIGVFKGRLEQRRGLGLPTPTESNRIRAATMIQALFRGYIVRQWSPEELAKDVKRRRHMADVLAVEEAAEAGEIDYLPRVGPPDMKQRVAFRVVYAARRAFVEYSAAVKIQKFSRGWFARRDIRSEIVKVAHATATVLQALYRRYRVVVTLVRHSFAATTIQSFWRRAVARQRVQTKRNAVRLIIRLGAGWSARNNLLKNKQAAVPVQCNVRGFLACNDLKRRRAGAQVVQRLFHGWRARRSIAVMRKAALKLSGLWRGHALRKRVKQRNAAALRIQWRWRFSQADVRCAKMQKAASKVGAAWRGYQKRKTKPYGASACKIQSHMRGVLVRERLRKIPTAARFIQSYWRAYRIRRTFKTRVALATVLQKMTRRHLTNHKLGDIGAATVVCQKLIRGDRSRKRWKRIQRGVTRIQAVWRSTQPKRRVIIAERAAQRIQTFVRRRQAQHRFQKYRNAAGRIKGFWDAHRVRLSVQNLRNVVRIIARWVRPHLIRRKRERLNFAATQLQRCWRGQNWRNKLKRRHAAATHIQASLLGRHRQVCWNTFRLRAIIGIQKIWKGRGLRRQHLAKKQVARVLQCQFRGYTSRKQLAAANHAASQIQARWKQISWRARVDLRNRSATKIESALLGMLDRKRCRQRTECMLKMQCLIRSQKACLERDRRGPAAQKIACWMRSRLYPMRLKRLKKAALRIQEFFRAKQARRRYLKLKKFVRICGADRRQDVHAANLARHLGAVATIQKCWRRTAVRMRLHERSESAVVVQKFVRGWLAVLKAQREHALKLHLTLALQSHWRRKQASRQYAKQKKLQFLLARTVRVFLERRRIHKFLKKPGRMIVSSMKMKLATNAVRQQRRGAVTIQRHARGYLTRRGFQRRHELGPLRIQSVSRMCRAKAMVERQRYYAHYQEVRCAECHELKQRRREETAATQIQAFQRMRFQRNRFQKTINFALPKIQALNRMWLERDEYRALKNASICIQKHVRAYCASRLPRQHTAATAIQRVWRRYLVLFAERKEHFSEFVAQTNAASTIQKIFRRYVKHWKYLRILVATVRIQAMVRMHLRRKHWNAQVAAATRIQASFMLINLAKRRVNHRRGCVIKMQAMARKGLVRIQLAQQKASAIRLQAVWRAALTRSLALRRRYAAATRLQAYWRMRYQRKVLYVRRRAAQTRIQSRARGFLVRKRKADQDAAAARIQIRYTINKIRHRLEMTRWLVLALQKLWRGKSDRRKTADLRKHIRQRPALVRGRIARNKVKDMVKAAVKIQRIVRGQNGRAHLRFLHTSATTVQGQMRIYLARKLLKLRQRARHRISSMVLRWKLRRNCNKTIEAYSLAVRSHQVHAPVELHRKVIDSVVHIQRVERGTQGRKRIWRMHAAARLVQKYARSWLARGRVHRQLCAVAKMQALVDGAYRRRRLAGTVAKVRKLQTYVRKHLARQKLLEVCGVETRIARIRRGGLERARLKRQQAAASTIARRVQVMLAVKRRHRQKLAAVKIQAVARGHLTRADMHDRRAAATKIACSWRKHCKTRQLRAKCKSVAVMFGGSMMWHQVAVRKRRIRAATTIQAFVRSRNVHCKVRLMHESARKIQRTWKAVQLMRFTQDMSVQILVRAKLIKEAYLTEHVIVIQRAYRNWRRRDVAPFKKFRAAVAKLQARQRRYKVAEQVAYFRQLVGTRVKRFTQKVAVLHPDRQGRLTQARDVSPEESVDALPPPLRITKLVDIQGMSTAQRELLAWEIAPIQAMAKYNRRIQRVLDIQRIWRSYAVRRSFLRRRQAATFIQAVWRAKTARNRLKQARAAATKIQAHVRRLIAMNARRRLQEERLDKAFAAITDLDEEVVEGVRVRSGGSVSN